VQDIRYRQVHSELQSTIPELNDRFQSESWVVTDPDGPLQYLVVELILNPLLRELLDAGGKSILLDRIFGFFERMAISSDPEVRNLLAVGIFEPMVSQPARMGSAWRYMGIETKKLARRVARGLRREQGLPRE
jgi:hypothetical protein